MKKLSTTNSLYLLLASKILSFSVAIFLALIMGKEALDFQQNNIIFKLFDLILTIVVYINLATINEKFQKASVCGILYATVSVISIFIKNVTTTVFLGFNLFNINEIIIHIFNVLTVYYFYKGFCMLTQQYDNKLYAVWKKLGIINLAISIISFLLVFTSDVIVNFISQYFMIVLLLALLGLALFVVLYFTEFIYIIKTIKSIQMSIEKKVSAKPKRGKNVK